MLVEVLSSSSEWGMLSFVCDEIIGNVVLLHVAVRRKVTRMDVLGVWLGGL
jgi:hypothetical protein